MTISRFGRTSNVTENSPSPQAPPGGVSYVSPASLRGVAGTGIRVSPRLALLVDEGLVVIVPGKGAFVKPQQ